MKHKFLITTLLATTAFATNAVADCTPENGDCGNNCTYTINADCHLVVQGPTKEGDTGYIRDYAFQNNTNITSAEIKGNIREIRQYAFKGASNLTSVTIPNSVTKISSNVFRGASSLTSVTIPNSVTSIGDSAFPASGLKSIVIPDSITSISNNAFSSITNLVSVMIGDSVESIGVQAFSGNTNLISVTIPDSVTNIEPLAFADNTSLTSVVIPASTTIGVRAFRDIPSSAEIFCPDQACKDNVTAAGYGGTNFVDYTKGSDGIYTVGDTMYASADDMRAHQNACTSEAQCREQVQKYKEDKAEQMAQNGVLCQTKTGCLKLMDMVSGVVKDSNGDAYVCGVNNVKNSIANCSTYAKSHQIALNDPDPEPEPEIIPTGGGNGGTDGSDGQDAPKRRIYTIQEATDRVKELGTDTVNFRIRYK